MALLSSGVCLSQLRLLRIIYFSPTDDGDALGTFISTWPMLQYACSHGWTSPWNPLTFAFYCAVIGNNPPRGGLLMMNKTSLSIVVVFNDCCATNRCAVSCAHTHTHTRATSWCICWQMGRWGETEGCVMLRLEASCMLNGRQPPLFWFWRLSSACWWRVNCSCVVGRVF